MASRERQISGRAHLKEKVIQIYENLFASRDISEGRSQFWDEFFLLRVNMKSLLSHFDQLNFEKLNCLSNQMSQIFLKCIQTIQLKRSHIRMANAIQTACCLIEGVFNCVNPKPSPFHSIEERNSPTTGRLNECQLASLMILVGRDNPEKIFSDFIESCAEILIGSHPHRLKCLILKLYLTIASVCNDIERNCLLPFLYSDSLYDWLIDSLSCVDSSTNENDAVNLFALLLYYHSEKGDCPYRSKFRLESNGIIFQQYSAFALKELLEFNEHFRKSSIESQGFLSSLSSIIGSALVGGEKPVESFKTPECSLFCLYVGMMNNEELILSLIDTTPSTSKCTSPDGHSGEKTMPLLSDETVNDNPTKLLNHSLSLSSNDDSVFSSVNVMVLLLEYASIAMQDTKDPSNQDACRLCLTLCLLICECDPASSILHDNQMNFKVNLHKMPMRHRKSDKKLRIKAQPLAYSLLDLTNEYICCHLMNPLPIHSYSVCMHVIQRLICYQKKTKVRLEYDWKQIWSALFNLMRYLLSIENHLSKSPGDSLDLLLEIMKIFNLFITYGDSFLPSTSTYDDLYYELIRMCVIFENTFSMTSRYSSSCESEVKSKALQLLSQLDNIKSIIGHFTPKIEVWSTQNRQTSLSQNEVMDIIKANYETLTLKLLPGLDKFVPFDENILSERRFFSHLMESILITIRSDTLDSNILQQQYLHELSLMNSEIHVESQ